MDKAEELLTAIGALAEMLGLYRDILIQNGFTRKESIELCIAYQDSMTNGSKKGGNNDG